MSIPEQLPVVVYGQQASFATPEELAFQQNVMTSLEPVIQSTKVALRSVADDYSNIAIAKAKQTSIGCLKQYSETAHPTAKAAFHASVDTSAAIVEAGIKHVVRVQLDRAERAANEAVTTAITNTATVIYPYTKAN